MIYNFDSLVFNVIAIDRFTHKKGCFNVKGRPYAALSFRTCGMGSFKIGNKNITVNKGDILFIPENAPYEVEYSVSESIVVHMTACNYYEPENIKVDRPDEIAALFELLVEKWQKERSLNGVKSGVYAILEKIEKNKSENIEDRAFVTCLEYVNSHYCDPLLNIETVAKEGYISVSGLQRMFLRHFGMSPMQYVIKLRMNKAIGLLVGGTATIKEVSELSGFSDEKYFSRAFKQRYGYPPSKLRG